MGSGEGGEVPQPSSGPTPSHHPPLAPVSHLVCGAEAAFFIFLGRVDLTTWAGDLDSTTKRDTPNARTHTRTHTHTHTHRGFVTKIAPFVQPPYNRCIQRKWLLYKNKKDPFFWFEIILGLSFSLFLSKKC